MREALVEAAAAAAHDDVPVGAVIVVGAGNDARIVGRGHNRREIDRDPTAHAEVLAIRAAALSLGTWYLVDTTLYVTHEPCAMCAGAVVNARVQRLVFGCENPKAGAVKTLYQIPSDSRLNHRAEVTGGVLADECGAALSDFFRRLRSRDRGGAGPG